MATSFVEQAVLKVKDQSTRPIRKINNELKKLFATAKKGKSIEVIDLRKLAKADREVKNLNRTLRSLPRRKSIAVQVTGIQNARKQLNSLTKNRTVKINATVNQSGGSGGNRTGSTGGTRTSPPSTFLGGLQAGFSPEAFGRGIAHGFTSSVGHELYYQVRNAITDGLTGGVAVRENADSALAIVSATKEQRNALKQDLPRLRDLYKVFDEGQIANLQAEAFTATGGDQEATAAVVENTLRLAYQRFLSGTPVNSALEGGAALFRAIENTKVSDAKGKLDIEQLERGYISMQRIAALLKDDFNVSKIDTAFKKAGVALSNYTDEALTMAGLFVEAGLTGFDLQGFFDDFAIGRVGETYLANQQRLGLTSQEARAAAASDPERYVSQFLIPAFEKEAASGVVNTWDEFLLSIADNQTARRTATLARNQGGEFREKVENSRTFQLSEAQLRAIGGENVRAQAVAAQQSLQNVVSSTALSMEALATPLFQAAEESLNFVSDAIKADQELGMAGLAAGGVGYGIVQATIKSMAPLVQFGTLQGLLDPDTTAGEKALLLASTNLDSAASKLSGGTFGLPNPAAGKGPLAKVGSGIAMIASALDGIDFKKLSDSDKFYLERVKEAEAAKEATAAALAAQEAEKAAKHERLQFLSAEISRLEELKGVQRTSDTDLMIQDNLNEYNTVLSELRELSGATQALKQSATDAANGLSYAASEAGKLTFGAFLPDGDGTGTELPSTEEIKAVRKAIDDQAAILNNGFYEDDEAARQQLAALLALEDAMVKALEDGGTGVDAEGNPYFLEPHPDLAEGLSTPIEEGHRMGADIMSESLSEGGLTLGQVIRESLSAGAEELRDVLRANFTVAVPQPATPQLGAPLDTGRQTPF